MTPLPPWLAVFVFGILALARLDAQDYWDAVGFTAIAFLIVELLRIAGERGE